MRTVPSSDDDPASIAGDGGSSMDRLRLLLAGALLLAALLMPVGVYAAGGPAPTEPCVPGSVWEDPSSGVRYLCVYDEVYGGPRWVLMSGGQRGASGFPYRSSTYGCLQLSVGLSGLNGSGADAIGRTYRWPCSPIRDRVTQPAGELRSRVVVQRYGGAGWSTCRDSGYRYNTSTAFGWVAGIGMGGGADCGTGSYRAVGYSSYFQGGLWRGGTLYTPLLWLP
jgi:hypothetical protein